MGRLKKIAVRLFILIMFNVFSIGCFAMEKGNTEKNVISKNEKQEKNNKKEGDSNFGLNFFDVKQNENVLLGRKIKPEKQENNFFDKNENKLKKPCFENINSVNLNKDNSNNKENEKSNERLKLCEEYLIAIISKLLKEPFSFDFFKYSNTKDWTIPKKLKFIVDEYKKDILDYYLKKNFKFMYQKYIDKYLKKKEIKEKCNVEKCNVNIRDRYIRVYENMGDRLIKNCVNIEMPKEFFDSENLNGEELLKELTTKAKVILGNAAVKTREDLKNISDLDFEYIKSDLLLKSRHFENDKDFNGYWNYIEKGLKQLKKDDLCYSYLDDPDNFIQSLGYVLKYISKNGRNFSRSINNYLYISNDNGLKIYDTNDKQVKDIQFEDFNIKEAIFLANQKSPENIKREDIDKYLFLEDREEKAEQIKFATDEFKKLVFVDAVLDNISINVNDEYKNINNIGNINEKIEIIRRTVIPREQNDELRKTRFSIVFPKGVDEEQALKYAREIAYKVKKIIGQAIIVTKRKFDNASVCDFDNLKKNVCSRKDFKQYLEKRFNKEEIEALSKELKKITTKDTISIFDYFKKFENFIETINFKYRVLNNLNKVGESKCPVNFSIEGEDLKNDSFKYGGFTIKFEDYDLEEELKKAEQNKRMFISRK